MDFSEIIVVSDVKVGRFSQLNEYMNLYEYIWITQIQYFKTFFLPQ